MRVAVVKESYKNEHRVAISPEIVKKIVKMGAEVVVEDNAGKSSSFLNKDYQKAGAEIKNNLEETVKNADLILKIQPPSESELQVFPKGSTVIGNFNILADKKKIKLYENIDINTISMDLIPRITRAQSMDILSSQSNLAGYTSVILASDIFKKSLPMMMTAAGTIPPAKVLILGAGVAGLQAIATAKRLGALVFAFDVRPDVKEQVESLGANFVEVEDTTQQSESSGGYATEMNEDYKKKQNDKIHQTIKKSDIVITTALIPGKKSPLLVTNSMVKDMKSGSVIVDLASIAGGNCELTKHGDTIITDNMVTIVGPENILNSISYDATQLYARNIWSYLQILLTKENGNLSINIHSDDEIIKESLLTIQGKIVKK